MKSSASLARVGPKSRARPAPKPLLASEVLLEDTAPLEPDRGLSRIWMLCAAALLFGIGALCLIYAVDSVAGLIVRMVTEDAGPRSLGGLIISIISQLVSAFLSVVLFVMLARIYVQRTGAGAVQASVPSSGT